jgi:hypothetical protein
LEADANKKQAIISKLGNEAFKVLMITLMEPPMSGLMEPL